MTSSLVYATLYNVLIHLHTKFYGTISNKKKIVLHLTKSYIKHLTLRSKVTVTSFLYAILRHFLIYIQTKYEVTGQAQKMTLWSQVKAIMISFNTRHSTVLIHIHTKYEGIGSWDKTVWIQNKIVSTDRRHFETSIHPSIIAIVLNKFSIRMYPPTGLIHLI